MILTGEHGEKFVCKEIGDRELALYRVFGSLDEISLPDEINGSVITTIGEYCFAPNGHTQQSLSEEMQRAGLGDGIHPVEGSSLRPLCGNYVQKISLPDSVTSVEAYAFYNCKNLSCLLAGKQLNRIGSDAFMNCRHLGELQLRASVEEKTGLPLILNQVSSEVTVRFTDGEEPTCVLYPEYTESYEEIGPAHIFSLHVEGEGYRARKQFVDGRVDLAGYDQVFEKACNEEHFLTLMKMALCRLEYPYQLSNEAKDRYEQYIISHDREVMTKLAASENADTLAHLCGMKYISNDAIAAAITAAISHGWTKGVAGIIRWRNDAIKAGE